MSSDSYHYHNKTNEVQERIIGEYCGDEPGPLLVVFGAMHGNEPAGVKALDLVMKMLEVESITNPKFSFKGKMIALVGNCLAFHKKRRFMDHDLNRSWTDEIVDQSLTDEEDNLTCEQQEIKEIMHLLKREVETYQPSQLIVLDLHTTSSHGGIFSIATDDPMSLSIAKELHAPVILGMLDGIKGTSMHYFRGTNFGIPTTSLAFESGQHNDTISVRRAIAAVINCLRTLGCVAPDDVENVHDAILIEFSEGLPKVSELVTKHSIAKGDSFEMLPNFKSFDVVHKGQHLANNIHGPIHCPADGRILMPLYQKQGEDGFFIIKDA